MRKIKLVQHQVTNCPGLIFVFAADKRNGYNLIVEKKIRIGFELRVGVYGGKSLKTTKPKLICAFHMLLCNNSLTLSISDFMQYKNTTVGVYWSVVKTFDDFFLHYF